MAHAFRQVSRTYVEEIPAEVREFLHEKTGARLLAFLNDDDNKVFTIAFRTPPPSSNGLPHILEHSVLNGSRKYPSKEPFVELLKGSLATFLNAMTYPDKTVYPVASRNEKDFFNLVDVYLDAVFFPRLIEDPHILMQEGWHYELLGEDQPLEIRGVVYNEMKGAYSSPEAVLFKAVQEGLFPDTPYRFDSGGDPAVIPTLDQTSFVEFHSAYYHPSNSRIIVYGDVDLEAFLQKLDQEYLSRFEKREVDSSLPLQMPFPEPKEARARYSLPRGTSPEGKDYLAFAAVVAEAAEPEVHMAFEVLTSVLVESPAAPLKKVLLERGLGEDVMAFFEDSLQQPVFGVAVKNG
ncbi:MAG: insulinase family protein, partial [Bacillota bacterium]|nr:insulinase family protein [Bacillota bacterium]